MTPQTTDSPESAIRALRVTVGGLMAGLLAFAILAFLIRLLSQFGNSNAPASILFVLAAAVTGCAVGYFRARRSLVMELRSRAAEFRQVSDPSRLALEPYRRFVVLAAGLIEAPALFGVVAYLVTGRSAGLVVAVLALLLLAAHMPSLARLRRLAEDAAARS